MHAPTGNITLERGSAAGLLLVAMLLAGPAITTAVLATSTTPLPSATFSPVIDGTIQANEHWELAENIHLGFLQVDTSHQDDYNFIYTKRHGGFLYIAVDLCSDITDDAANGEWITLWIDADNSQHLHVYQNFYPNSISDDNALSEHSWNIELVYSGVNTRLANGSLEVIAYNTTAGGANVSIVDYSGPSTVDSTANFTVAYDFGLSPNSNTPHRTYEFKIPLADLDLMGEASPFGLAVLGYGTMAPPTVANPLDGSCFYALPAGSAAVSSALVASWYSWRHINGYDPAGLSLQDPEVEAYALLLLASMERYYYPCGPTAPDLLDNPILTALQRINNTAFTPVLDGVYEKDERWDLAENIHAMFLHVDQAHTEHYNYLYTKRQGGYLWVLVDLVSDTTDDALDGEWITLCIDSDRSNTLEPWMTYASYDGAGWTGDELAYNMLVGRWDLEERWSLNNGSELVAYNATSGETNISLYMSTFFSVSTFESTTPFEVAFGFGPSPNSATPHRTYEFKIPLSGLENMTETSDFGISVNGYGTLSYPQAYEERGYYSLTRGSGSIYAMNGVAWLYKSVFNNDRQGKPNPNDGDLNEGLHFLQTWERYFLPCGPSASIKDLADHPLYFKQWALHTPDADPDPEIPGMVPALVMLAGIAGILAVACRARRPDRS